MARLRIALIFLLAGAAATAAAHEPAERLMLDSLTVSTVGYHAVAGVWQMRPSGAVFEVRPTARSGEYTLIMIDSPDYTVPAGICFGTLTAGAEANVYDASLLRKPQGDSAWHTGRSKSFVVRIDPAAGRMTMKEYRRHAGLTLYRWASYLFRMGVSRASRPEGVDGAVRIAPFGASEIISL